MTVVVARESLVAAGHRAIPKGSLIDSSDPVVKANPDLFESPEAAVASKVPEAVETVEASDREDTAPVKARTRK